MAYETMRTGIYDLLVAVTGISSDTVYKRQIIEKVPATFDNKFTAGDPAVINTWAITNDTPIPEDPRGLGSGANIRRRWWTWKIEGWYEFNYTDSEATFDALVEAICTAFRGQNLIGGATYQSDTLQVETKDLVGFSGGNEAENGVLCHHVVMTLMISVAV